MDKPKEIQVYLEDGDLKDFHGKYFQESDTDSVQFEGAVEYGLEMIIRRTYPIDEPQP